MGQIDIQTNIRPVKDLLPILLYDRTTRKNIIFASESYAHLGEEYGAKKPILPEILTVNGRSIIQPRVLKDADEQEKRTRKKAEVFTPSWVCAMMNDYLDEEWFGRENVFGRLEDRRWTPEENPVVLPKRKRWQRYVDSRRLEITCGEAPYLASRYDTATGEEIPVRERIGILDRKLRIVGENTNCEEEWLRWAFRALESVYGYEYQGDNLLVARLNLVFSFRDHLREKWGRDPSDGEYARAARIVSWNLWQMDGLKGTIPLGALYEEYHQISFLEMLSPPAEEEEEEYTPCRVYDWRGQNKSVEFSALRERRNGTMKFDFIIGNPPYQVDVEDSDNKTFKPPIYDKFMDTTFEIADKVVLIHPARFLFNAGQTPKVWNEKMLSDPHFKVIHYEPDGSKVFANTEIKGGIAISYHDKNTNFGAIQVFTKYDELNSILHRVSALGLSQNLTDIMANQNRFDLDTLINDHPEYRDIIGSNGKDRRFRNNIFDKVDLFTSEKKSDDDIAVLGVVKNKRQWRYFPKRYIDLNHKNLSKWKVLIGAASGAGIFGEALSTPIIIEPLQGYTQTYIGVGAFETRDEAANLEKYFHTKFLRTMLGILKITQHNEIGTWRMVPLQNFTASSDIDWSQSIAGIDRQLYAKYGLSDEEIAFIETHVKEME